MACMDRMFVPPPDLPPVVLLALGWLVLLNAAAYALAGIDRSRAASGRSRVSETVLLWLAALGAWPGLKLALRRSARVRYSFAFRGWINGAIAAQVILFGMAALPQGSFVVMTEKIAAILIDDARAAERRAGVDRIVLDSERAGPRLKNVVPLRADP